MTKERLKELLPIMQAYIDGKTIQYLDSKNNWQDLEDPAFDSCLMKYRIKPESNYRPFNNVEECWEEMQKHQPVGWIKTKTETLIYFDIEISEYADWEYLFRTYTFTDGTPYGMKE